MTRGTADRETVKLLHIVGPFFYFNFSFTNMKRLSIHHVKRNAVIFISMESIVKILILKDIVYKMSPIVCVCLILYVVLHFFWGGGICSSKFI